MSICNPVPRATVGDLPEAASEWGSRNLLTGTFAGNATSIRPIHLQVCVQGSIDENSEEDVGMARDWFK